MKAFALVLALAALPALADDVGVHTFARPSPHDRDFPDEIERKLCGYVAAGGVMFWRHYKISDLLAWYGSPAQCPAQVNATPLEMSYAGRMRPKPEDREKICAYVAREIVADPRLKGVFDAVGCK